MNYRFEISFPDTEFRCEIAIAGDQTFQQFHDKIIEVLEYDASQMASFYTLDKMGDRKKEIALMDMALGDEDIMVMNTTKIEEVVNADCIELEYVYDFFNNKYFKVEYAGEYKGESDTLPICVYCEGEIPEQMSFDPDEDWDLGKSDEEYDDSFMEEFNDYSEERDFDEGEDDFRDEDDFGGGDYDSQYDSIDDYIDKL